MVKVFVLWDLIHQLGSAKLHIWVLQVLHITTRLRKHLASSRLQNIYGVPLYLTSYPSFWLNYFNLSQNKAINVCLSDFYWIFLSGKSLGTYGRFYISPLRDFQYKENFNCQCTNSNTKIRSVFFLSTFLEIMIVSWFWRRNKEINSKKIRFCWDNAYSLLWQIVLWATRRVFFVIFILTRPLFLTMKLLVKF